MTPPIHSRTSTQTTPAGGRWIWITLVVALFCVPLFIGLDRTDLENDEAIYSYAVQRILVTSDWLTPRSIPSETDAFLEKPPLKFWIVALPIRLGLLPNNEIGLRFWDALFGSLGFLYVFAIGRRLAGSACGFMAVFALFVHRSLILEHGLRTNNMEAALFLAYCGGMYHFLAWKYAQDPKRQRLHAYAISLFFVLGFMTKFVAAFFLPLVFVASMLSRREDRLRLWRDWRIWVGPILLAVALIAPWFLYQFHQYGRQLPSIMFGVHVFTRFTGTLDPAHLRPWHYYVDEIVRNLRLGQVAGLAALGLVLVIVRIVRRGWPDGELLLWWLFLPLVLISLLTSKLYHYAYFLLPPLALATGYGVVELLTFVWSLLNSSGTVAQSPAAPRRFVVAPSIRIACLVVGLLAIGAAVASFFYGTVSISAFGHVLIRNSSPLRASLIGTVLLLVALLHTKTGMRVLMPLVVLVTLPITPYRDNLSLIQAEDRPLISARDCIRRVSTAERGADHEGPGVWAEGDVTHSFYYYLGGLGPWQPREMPSDPTVYMNLFAPSHYRPVLLSTARYAEFRHQMVSPDQELNARAARKAEMDPLALESSRRDATVGVVKAFNVGILLLPGPYAVCAPTQVTGKWK